MESTDNSQLTNENDHITNEKDKTFVTVQCKILFKRKFGQKLAFLSGLCEDNSELEIILKECKGTNYVKTTKIGDIYKINGYFDTNQGKRHFVPVKIETLYKAENADDLSKKRQIIHGNISKPKEEKCLCKKFKNENKCDLTDCPFRHFLLPNEEEKLQKQKLKREEILKQVYKNDPFHRESKLSKLQRNRLFADFLVDTYGVEYLKSGTVFDVAGGKGLVSFYLTTEYSIKCLVIDPRGVDLPKKQKQIMKESVLKIQEKKSYFDENIDEKIFIENSCVLLIGMHPDEATVSIVKTGEKFNKNYAVVPCCVFPTKFSDRKLKNGENVVDYTHLIKYIEELVPDISTAFLNIEGRNRILYKKVY